MEWQALIWATLGMAAGGVLKGATGGGAPVLAVPIIALFFDVPFAVAIFSMPNLLANLWQAWRYRANLGAPRLYVPFVVGGALGAAIGSVMLANLTPDALIFGVAMIVFLYIAFRLARPGWVLSRSLGTRVAGLAGTGAGILQGAGGISAPISITFLNAMQLPRAEFIATIARLFVAMALVQIPMLIWYGILDLPRLALSTAAAVPLFAAMPLGTWLTRHLSPGAFDRIILVLLAIIATRMAAGAVF